MKKNIIITGTSRGIGKELALYFANTGHQVLAISRNSSNELKENTNINCLKIDITNDEHRKKLEQFLKDNWKQVDILIHNAGSLINKPFTETTLNDFQQIYNINVFSVVGLTQVCLPFMSKGSHVVSISSMGGIQGSIKFPGLSAYSSSKGALITLSELLAEEYKEKGIAFNVLALGAVNTEMLHEAFPGYNAPLSAKEMAEYIFNFALTGNTYYNGKVLQVSSSTP